MSDKQITVTKADGERVPFEHSKLRNSLSRAGASDRDVEKIVESITPRISDGMSTSEIYHMAFELLRYSGQPIASRYSMKRAVFGLGPSGFPFERFVAEIFKSQGYEVKTDITVQGKCVQHEVDIVARLSGTFVVAEIKFHNRLGIKSDLKVPLYVRARFDDISEINNDFVKAKRWLVTNTKFSENALAYGKCVGIHMVDWNNPRDENLQKLIEKSGVQPVTCLTTLDDSDKKKLMDAGIVLCRHVQGRKSDLEAIGLSKDKADLALVESNAICHGSI